MHRYKQLRVWQKSMELVLDIYSLTKEFPENEKYGLISQINRSAVSIPSNIAEGAGRKNPNEFHQFLGIANGSLAELETQLEISRRLDLYSSFNYEELFESTSYIGKMISNLQRSIKNPNNSGASEPIENYNNIED
jgi:four helix bundle protein